LAGGEVWSRPVKWDLATILGMGSGFILVISAIAFGGKMSSFVDIPALFIVVGGTFAITMISFNLEEVLRAQSVMAKAVTNRINDPQAAAMLTMQLADRARREGLLSLEKAMQETTQDNFLAKALGLAVDGTPGDDLEQLLRRDVAAMALRHRKSANIFRKAAEVSPAMGLIGTLIGLIQMLANLNDPNSIGPAMSVALLTTFYGAILATMVFSPLANKLERNSEEEVMLQNVYLTAVASMCRQENPRRLEMVLNTILPPVRRTQYYD
jgi:chemotaxis protein MotA